MLRKKSRWSLIFPAQIHCTWLLKGEIYPWDHPPHTSDFFSAFSLKEHGFHRMFFQNESEMYFWVTMLLFCYFFSSSSQQFLLTAWYCLLYEADDITWTSRSVRSRIAFTSSARLLQSLQMSERAQKVSLAVNIKRGKAVAVFKGSLKRGNKIPWRQQWSRRAAQLGCTLLLSWHPEVFHQQ